MSVCELWTSIEALCCDKTKYSEEEQLEAIEGASEILSTETYNRFGVCTYQVSPCTNRCSAPCYDSNCDGYTLKPEILSGAEIQDILNITVYDENGDSSTVSTEDLWWEYDVIHFPKTFEFPAQAAEKPGAPNTWYITLTAGKPIPILGKKAAKELAMSILTFGCEDENCALPKGVKRIVRGGVEYEVQSEEDMFLSTPMVSRFLGVYGKVKRWSGTTSPLDYKSQLVNPQTTNSP